MLLTFIMSLVLCAACTSPAGRADRAVAIIDVHLQSE